MGYMDVAAKGTPNGRSVVLMHGKSFCGATWEGSIKALSDAGYRVVVPDQIGFCTSSKPQSYQYSFQQLANNTQPVYYEFKNLQVPTLLFIGTADTVALNSDLASPEVKAQIGNYNVLGKQVAKLIPRATLVEFEGLGHSPQIEEPERFHSALLRGLKAL